MGKRLLRTNQNAKISVMYVCKILSFGSIFQVSRPKCHKKCDGWIRKVKLVFCTESRKVNPGQRYFIFRGFLQVPGSMAILSGVHCIDLPEADEKVFPIFRHKPRKQNVERNFSEHAAAIASIFGPSISRRNSKVRRIENQFRLRLRNSSGQQGPGIRPRFLRPHYITQSLPIPYRDTDSHSIPGRHWARKGISPGT